MIIGRDISCDASGTQCDHETAGTHTALFPGCALWAHPVPDTCHNSRPCVAHGVLLILADLRDNIRAHLELASLPCLLPRLEVIESHRTHDIAYSHTSSTRLVRWCVGWHVSPAGCLPIASSVSVAVVLHLLPDLLGHCER